MEALRSRDCYHVAMPSSPFGLYIGTDPGTLSF